MEGAIQELRKLKGFEYEVLDRRNLSIRFERRDPEVEFVVKRALEMQHGFVESEAPLGRYDEQKVATRMRKMRKEMKKGPKAH